jgi:multidrug resistance efflux pump
MDSLKVRIDVRENEIGKVRVGQHATVEIWGSTYQGELDTWIIKIGTRCD